MRRADLGGRREEGELAGVGSEPNRQERMALPDTVIRDGIDDGGILRQVTGELVEPRITLRRVVTPPGAG